MTVTQERLTESCNAFAAALQAVKIRENSRNSIMISKKAATLLTVNRTMAKNRGYK